MLEERRTALAVVLCILVVMVYSQIVMEPYRRQLEVKKLKAMQEQNLRLAEQQKQNPTTDTRPSQIITTPSDSSAPARPAAQAPAANSHPTLADYSGSPDSVVESDRLEVRIDHLGARISSLKLKAYRRELKSPELLDLVKVKEGSALPLAVHAGGVSDDFVLYNLEAAGGAIESEKGRFLLDSKGSQKEVNLSFRGTMPDGTGIRKTFRFLPDTYLFDVNVELDQPTKDGSKVYLEWSYFFPVGAAVSYDPLLFTLLGENGKITRLPVDSVKEGLPEFGSNKWVSLGDKYFMTALVPRAQTNITRVGREGDVFLYRVSGSQKDNAINIFSGPKNHTELQNAGIELERNVDLGWFSFLAHPLLWLLKFFYSMLGNWGLAIILLTLVIKSLFLPLTRASFLSMQAMQDLQPEIKALRERIEDPAKLNQEMMALYKKRGVNPMGGCLPILIQLPVFLGLYNALLNAIELRHAEFALWINDLSSPESLNVLGIPVPVLIIIMGASMIIQQVLSPSAADPAQKKAMLMAPVIFTVMFIIFPFPAGLVLYWLVNNLISIIQQVYMKGDRKANPLQATVIGSLVIFSGGYVLTLL